MQRGKTQESESSTPKAALKAPLAASNMEEGGGGGVILMWFLHPWDRKWRRGVVLSALDAAQP